MTKEDFRHADNNRVIVVGAGAGGLIASGRAAELGASVLLLEKTERPGKKILISGKTRCNLSNTKSLKDFIPMYGENGPFLYSSFYHFFREDLLSLLKNYGVDTKTERGGRIFPASDRAGDVVDALIRYAQGHGAKIRTGLSVKKIKLAGSRVIGVDTEKCFLPAAAVILATGGATYPGTGSTGDGYRIARSAGHTITSMRPALVPLVVEEINTAKSLQGLSLRNVRLTAFRCPADSINPSLVPDIDIGRGAKPRRHDAVIIESRMGEMIFTHFGIGGPITLLMSLSVADALQEGPVSVSIDLKPALTRDQLRLRLQRDFDRFGKRGFKGILAGLLPQKMIDPMVKLTEIPPDLQGSQISSTHKEYLLENLKSLRFNIKSPLPMSSAIVTAGGVSLKEVDPRTMASRIINGLYFCGEVLDIDADTGGYNLQAAFSTGYLAGESAAASINL